MLDLLFEILMGCSMLCATAIILASTFCLIYKILDFMRPEEEENHAD